MPVKSRFQSDESVEIIRRCMRQSGGWLCAKDVAGMLGWPWRAAARALKFMSARGEIEERMIEVKAKKWRIRRRSIYRLKVSHDRHMPNWLMAKKIKPSRPPTRIVRF